MYMANVKVKGRRVMCRERNAAQTKIQFAAATRTVGSLSQTQITVARHGDNPAHTHKCALTLHATMGLHHQFRPGVVIIFCVSVASI